MMIYFIISIQSFNLIFSFWDISDYVELSLSKRENEVSGNLKST